jgi:multidrug efflux pump subunit AcrA (membrane-fusion protein)
MASMRVNVTFEEGEELEALAVVMAAVPSRDEGGKLRTIGPADAIRWAVMEMAKRGKAVM